MNRPITSAAGITNSLEESDKVLMHNLGKPAVFIVEDVPQTRTAIQDLTTLGLADENKKDSVPTDAAGSLAPNEATRDLLAQNIAINSYLAVECSVPEEFPAKLTAIQEQRTPIACVVCDLFFAPSGIGMITNPFNKLKAVLEQHLFAIKRHVAQEIPEGVPLFMFSLYKGFPEFQPGEIPTAKLLEAQRRVSGLLSKADRDAFLAVVPASAEELITQLIEKELRPKAIYSKGREQDKEHLIKAIVARIRARSQEVGL